jgi:hypothetical protein
MPIDLSNLSAEDIAATTTAAVEAARRAREEREHQAAEERRKQQEEERARQEATMRREVEERKEAAVWKAETERRDHLPREKAAQEAAAAEEQWQSLATGLSGLKLTIPAPASIAWTTSGSSTQSKGKRKATEEEPSASQYVCKGKDGPVPNIISDCRTRRFCSRLSTTSHDCDHNGHSNYFYYREDGRE